MVMTKPFGVDTLKIFAAKQPFDVNFFFQSLQNPTRGSMLATPVPKDGDWGVTDLIVETHAK